MSSRSSIAEKGNSAIISITEKMAFLSATTLTTNHAHRSHHPSATSLRPHRPQTAISLRRQRRITAQTSSQPPSTEAQQASETPNVALIPDSLAETCQNAISCARAAFDSGNSRLFIEIDTTDGDATYTQLKNSLPLARMILPLFAKTIEEDEVGDRCVQVLLPDSGIAAFARRDWNDYEIPVKYELEGMEKLKFEADKYVGAILVTPRASEVENMVNYLETVPLGTPVVMLNPDLVDMGVTGLSLNARTLRKNVIDKFAQAYFLKVFPWGVLLRGWPTDWGLWEDAPGGGFNLVATTEQRPSGDEIGEILSGIAESVGGSGVGGMLGGMLGKFKRFLDVYSRG